MPRNIIKGHKIKAQKKFGAPMVLSNLGCRDLDEGWCVFGWIKAVPVRPEVRKEAGGGRFAVFVVNGSGCVDARLEAGF